MQIENEGQQQNYTNQTAQKENKSKEAVPIKQNMLNSGGTEDILGNSFEEMDLEFVKNPQLVEIYAAEIIQNLMQSENNYLVGIQTINSIQIDITSKMRSILIDWIVEVHQMFALQQATLFLAVNIMDRYLQLKMVQRDSLQLLGITSLFIASKYEEIYPPSLKNYVDITDNAYTNQEFLKMEGDIILALEFNLNFPSPLIFLERYAQQLDISAKYKCFCLYILELFLIDPIFLQFKPSQQAAAVIYFLHRVTQSDQNPWNEQNYNLTGYRISDVHTCAKKIINLIQAVQDAGLLAIKKKYQQPQYYQISKIQFLRIN